MEERLNPDSLHLDICAFQFDMVAGLALTMRETTEERDIEENNEIERENEENLDTRYNNVNKDNDEDDINEEEMQTLNIYKMEKGTIGMMQKINIKLPSPTKFDGRYPQFNEWA
eukprot:5533192-Amphidinium_carterae.1